MDSLSRCRFECRMAIPGGDFYPAFCKFGFSDVFRKTDACDLFCVFL